MNSLSADARRALARIVALVLAELEKRKSPPEREGSAGTERTAEYPPHSITQEPHCEA